MMTGRRRNELNSLTDCLVYAGIVGGGLRLAGGHPLHRRWRVCFGESLLTAAMRLIMAPFAHSLFTTMFGIGVFFALHQRNAIAKAGCILLGYIGAVIMHGLWNGSSLLGVQAYFLVYLLWMVPIFALAIWLGVASRRREQRVVAAKLPGMVAAGLVTPNEATWLGSIRNRKLAIGEATRLGGRARRQGVKNFAAQVIELAFVRDRIDRGFGDERVSALLNEEAYGVSAARAAAPTLQSLAGYRITRRLMRGSVPAAAVADRHLQRHVQRVGAAHLVAHQRLDGVPLPLGDLEQQLVVHLQQHPGLQAGVPQRLVDVDHRHLDDVGGAALDRAR